MSEVPGWAREVGDSDLTKATQAAGGNTLALQGSAFNPE